MGVVRMDDLNMLNAVTPSVRWIPWALPLCVPTRTHPAHHARRDLDGVNGEGTRPRLAALTSSRCLFIGGQLRPGYLAPLIPLDHQAVRVPSAPIGKS